MNTSLREIKSIEKVFLERKGELDNGSPETRTYSEKQYIAQVLKILGAFKSMVEGGTYKVSLSSMHNGVMSTINDTLSKVEIDNLIVVQVPTDNQYEIDQIARQLEACVKTRATNKTFVMMPKGSLIYKAELLLEEDSYSE